VPAVPSCLLEPIWGEFAALLPLWVTMFSRWAVPAARSNRWSAMVLMRRCRGQVLPRTGAAADGGLEACG
jgi:hypothetical protein